MRGEHMNFAWLILIIPIGLFVFASFLCGIVSIEKFFHEHFGKNIGNLLIMLMFVILLVLADFVSSNVLILFMNFTTIIGIIPLIRNWRNKFRK